MIISGTLMLPGSPSTVRLAPGWIATDHDHIAQVHESESRTTDIDLGGDDCLIFPGFIDTHLHLPQFDSIGQDNLPLLQWLDEIIFPAESRWENPDYARSMTQRVAHQLLSHGTTSIAAYATVHAHSAQITLDLLADLGFAGCVGHVLMDRNAPDFLLKPATQLIDEAAAAKPKGRLTPAITPRFAISCTPDLLEGAGQLASKFPWPIQTHLAETVPECLLIAELFNNTPYTQVYDQFNLLTEKTILAHGIWLDQNDHALIKSRNAIIAHCPTANEFLRAGTMNRADTLVSGVKLSLGSDVAGGPDRSMVRVARAMIDAAKAVNTQTPPSAAQCFWQITQSNADILNLPTTGTIKAGNFADLLVIKPDIPWQDSPNPLSTLLYAWDDRWLKATIIQGQLRYQAE